MNNTYSSMYYGCSQMILIQRLVFGSREGSIVIWLPSSNKKMNSFQKFKISNSVIDMVHLYQDRLFLVECGNIHIFQLDKSSDLQHLNSFTTGSQYFTRFTYCCLGNRVVYSLVGDCAVWVCDLSSASRQSFTLQEDCQVKKLWQTYSQSNETHLLIALGNIS